MGRFSVPRGVGRVGCAAVALPFEWVVCPFRLLTRPSRKPLDSSLMLKRAAPNVLIVPPAVVLELFALARFAHKAGLLDDALRMLLALRRLRPDVPEFSSYSALVLMDEGRFAEAVKILEEYLASGFDDCSLVVSLLAYLRYKDHDARWRQAALRAAKLAEEDGGGPYQTEILASLPTWNLNDRPELTESTRGQ